MLVIYQSEWVRLEIEGLNDDHQRLEMVTICELCEAFLMWRDFAPVVRAVGMREALVTAMQITDDEVVGRHQRHRCPFMKRG